MTPLVRLRSSPTRCAINCTKVCLSCRILDSRVLVRMVREATSMRIDGVQPANRIATTILKRSNLPRSRRRKPPKNGIDLVQDIAIEKLGSLRGCGKALNRLLLFFPYDRQIKLSRLCLEVFYFGQTHLRWRRVA